MGVVERFFVSPSIINQLKVVVLLTADCLLAAALGRQGREKNFLYNYMPVYHGCI